MSVVRELFPTRKLQTWPPRNPTVLPPFTKDELEVAMNRVRNGKAPGPDGLTGEMVKLIFRAAPNTCLQVFNECLTMGVFPAPWETADLKLIPKPRKPGQTTTSYRPICLISAMGKVLERLLVNRIERATDHLHSPRQFGFRKIDHGCSEGCDSGGPCGKNHEPWCSCYSIGL